MRSDDIAERFWSLPQKPSEEARREQLFLDDVIQMAHLDREIASALEGVVTALDAGAGIGRFSLPLAARGVHVTHLDISAGMIDWARQKAGQAGLLEKIAFVHAPLSDLASYPSSHFDLVLCFDAPISYSYPNHLKVIAELVRVCRKRIIFCVSSRLGYLHICLNPIQKEPYFADPDGDDPLVRFYRQKGQSELAKDEPRLAAAWDVLKTGLISNPEETERAYDSGHSPWAHNYLFLPEELEAALQASGVSKIRLSGPGALSRGIPNSVLRSLLLSDQYRRSFLDLCYAFDSHPANCGMGRFGLVASGCVSR